MAAPAPITPSPVAPATPAEPPPATRQLPQDEPALTQTASATPTSPSPAPVTPPMMPAPVHAPLAETAPPAPAAATPPQTTAAIPSEPARASSSHSTSTATVRRDYGWLTETLRSRIEQFKRYPPVARLNQWEGKVVLRAVIKETGDVTDLRIAQSSGHDVLDQDALETLRQAAPFPLKEPLGRPQIVVHIPINYKLDR